MTGHSENSFGTIGTLFLACLTGLAPDFVWAAFSSDSTGADGALNPIANVELQIPPSGIFNYTSVNIPTGVTVTFRKNANNSPVTILASADVTVAGTIDISGKSSQNVGTSLLADYTAPGVGGPGGFDGGRGGTSQVNSRAGNGLGPGSGGGGSRGGFCNDWPQGGGGGAFKVAGGINGIVAYCATNSSNTGTGGAAYGTDFLVPLLGGSGGGGGAGGITYQGSGGGGGGGAILIAASGTINVTGSILANGGTGGNAAQNNLSTAGSCGGGGSGGAIRIVASSITGNGALNVTGGTTCTTFDIRFNGGGGGIGRISTQAVTSGTINVTGFPTLNISSVAGIAVPVAPTGSGDVTLPTDMSNPVTVVLNTTGVPVTNTIKLTVTPERGGPATSVTSPTLTGTIASATTSVNIDVPTGPSTLFATTSYTITVAQGEALSKFAKGERVERVMLSASLNNPSTITLKTISGKEYTIPSTMVAGILGS
ncbi:MAG: hypothetical protein AAB263_06050 [Planctomycetota bacterium]